MTRPAWVRAVHSRRYAFFSPASPRSHGLKRRNGGRRAFNQACKTARSPDAADRARPPPPPTSARPALLPSGEGAGGGGATSQRPRGWPWQRAPVCVCVCVCVCACACDDRGGGGGGGGGGGRERVGRRRGGRRRRREGRRQQRRQQQQRQQEAAAAAGSTSASASRTRRRSLTSVTYAGPSRTRGAQRPLAAGDHNSARRQRARGRTPSVAPLSGGAAGGRNQSPWRARGLSPPAGQAASPGARSCK